MKLYDEVNRFARDYIKHKSLRSTWKKRKILEAYELITGEKIKVSCNTCYIEALLTIVKNTTMAAQNYELKKGVVLQAFGQPTKTCTNDTLTDALAEWYLTHYPEKIIFFSRVPAKFRAVPPKNITIVKPEKVNAVEEVKTEEVIPDEAPGEPKAKEEVIEAPEKKVTLRKSTAKKPHKTQS